MDTPEFDSPYMVDGDETAETDGNGDTGGTTTVDDIQIDIDFNMENEDQIGEGCSGETGNTDWARNFEGDLGALDKFYGAELTKRGVKFDHGNNLVPDDDDDACSSSLGGAGIREPNNERQVTGIKEKNVARSSPIFVLNILHSNTNVTGSNNNHDNNNQSATVGAGDSDEFDALFDDGVETTTPPQVLCQQQQQQQQQQQHSLPPTLTITEPDSHTQNLTDPLPTEKRSNNNTNPPGASDMYLQAQQEWAAVGEIIPGSRTSSMRSLEQSSLITLEDALQHMLKKDLRQYIHLIKPTVSLTGWAAFKNIFFGPPKLRHDLIQERNIIYCLALCRFEDNDHTQCKILQTIYKQLTGNKLDCPRFGAHWDQVGFQGNDPITDLRSAGMFGLLQLLFFVTDAKIVPHCRQIYKLSQHETQNFPFCLVGINLTRIVLQLLREGRLNKECNHGEGVIPLLNQFYTGLYLQMYLIWKTQCKTIQDAGFVFNELEKSARKQPKQVLRTFDNFLKLKQEKSSTCGGVRYHQGEESFSFDNTSISARDNTSSDTQHKFPDLEASDDI